MPSAILMSHNTGGSGLGGKSVPPMTHACMAACKSAVPHPLNLFIISWHLCFGILRATTGMISLNASLSTGIMAKSWRRIADTETERIKIGIRLDSIKRDDASLEPAVSAVYCSTFFCFTVHPIQRRGDELKTAETCQRQTAVQQTSEAEAQYL